MSGRSCSWPPGCCPPGSHSAGSAAGTSPPAELPPVLPRVLRCVVPSPVVRARGSWRVAMVSSGVTGGSVTDQHLVRVLRPFVRGTRPVLEALRESDPFGLRRRVLEEAVDDGSDAAERGALATVRGKVLDWVSAVHVPGTPAWAA